jgi:leader peptidase (prepilin peptidase) / N-methyltransferase
MRRRLMRSNDQLPDPMPAVVAPLFLLGLVIGRLVSAVARAAPRPVVAIGLGALYASTYLIVGDDGAVQLVLALSLCTVLVAITLTDLERRLIPNRILFAGATAAVAIAAVGDAAGLGDRVLAALAAGGVMLGVALAFPPGMGMGDVKLVAMMGLYLGRAIAPALLVAFAFGAALGLAMIVRYGVQSRKRAIPFGPFLALGGVIASWSGDELVEWYLNALDPSD